MRLEIKESSYNYKKYNLITKDEYDYWFNVGLEAFERGDKCIPARNKELMDYLTKHNAKIGSTESKKSDQIFMAWGDGWHYGNMHQDIEEKLKINEGYYENDKISKLLFDIENTDDNKKIDKAYSYIDSWLDNPEDVYNDDYYDFKYASWGTSEDNIISYLTNILNESIKRHTKSLREKETPNIEVKHKGILEVPEGKNVDDLPLSHFVKLANKKGLSKITKALNNLQVWNKNDDPKLSKWAGDMIDKLNKKLGKDESIRKNNKRSIKESLSFEDIEFVMNNYIQNKVSGIEIINDDKKGNYKIKYNNVVVDLSFNLDDNTASYVYTINAEGPYSTNSYERITMDIKDYVDFNIEENTKLTIREPDEILIKEDSKKSYWKYNVCDPAIRRLQNADNNGFGNYLDRKKCKKD